jgi:hypothetical protein
MRPFLLTLTFALTASTAFAQSKPVCDTFTDAEVAGLLGTAPSSKHAILGAQNDCVWGATGITFSVNRVAAEDADTAKAFVDARANNPGGDTVKPEPGIGDAAISDQGRYGRSVALVFRAGTTAWTLNLEKVDQKLDMAVVLPKLRALAKKAAEGR